LHRLHGFWLNQCERFSQPARVRSAVDDETARAARRIAGPRSVIDRQAAYRRGRDAAETATPDEYAGPMCLTGLAHCTALRGGDRATVEALAGEALARLAAATNRAVRVHALERHAESLEQLGDPVAAERHRSERAALMTAHQLPPARWRPIAAAAADAVALGEVETLFTVDTAAADRDASMTQNLSWVEGYLPEQVKAR